MRQVFRGTPVKPAHKFELTLQLPPDALPPADCPAAEPCPEPAELQVGWAWSDGSTFAEDGEWPNTFLEPHIDIEFGEFGYADQTVVKYAVVVGSPSGDIVWHVQFVEGTDGGTSHPRISACTTAIVFTWPGDNSYLAGTYTLTPYIDGVSGESITLTVTAFVDGGS